MKTEEFTHEMRQLSAVLGRNSEVQVHFEGDEAKTNGKEVILPSLPQGVTLTEDEVKIMRGYVDHEAGHLRHTDFDEVNKLGREGNESMSMLHNCLEDMWLEKKVMEEYQGSGKNLSSVNEFIKEKELDFVKENPEVFSKVNLPSVGLAITATGRKDYERTEMNSKVLDVLPSNLKGHAERWIEEVHKCENTGDVVNLTRAVYKYLEEDPELEQDPEDFDPEDYTEGEPSDEEGEEQEGGGQPQEGGKGEGQGHPLEGEQPDGPPQDEGEMISEMLGDRVIKEGDYKGAYRVLSTRDDVTYEGEELLKRFTGRHCKDGYEEKKSKVQSHINVMKSKLRRSLLARENRDWDYGRELGRLDTKRLVSGYNGAQNIYKARKDRDEMDTAIEVLIDLSGSMYDKRAYAATQMAIALAECFEGTQIKYEITGFSNGNYQTEFNNDYEKYADQNYHRVDILRTFVFKSFTDKLFNKRDTVGKIDGYVGGGNSDRDAVMWAHQRLRSRPEKRKILLAISDGQPANTTSESVGYGELERHLREYVEGIKDVECIGIGVHTDHVENLYPKSVVINDMEEFSSKVMGELSNVLTDGKLRL